jgi:hypothetical protein
VVSSRGSQKWEEEGATVPLRTFPEDKKKEIDSPIPVLKIANLFNLQQTIYLYLRHGFADPDQDLHQNFTDPGH